jgi:hypothetical protein
MSTVASAVSFQQLVADVLDKESWKGKGDFAVWSGECAESALKQFLTDWGIPNDGMNYVMLEFMDRILWRDGQAAEVKLSQELVAELEGGRIFGERGDLSLRRACDVFRWHFVGAADSKPPQGEIFWDLEPHACFMQCDESALLWGKRDPDKMRWFEDRVARADLRYPISVPDSRKSYRARIHYTTFSRAGRVEFVWFKRLEAVEVKDKEAQNA